MLRASLVLLLTVVSVARAQTTVTAREAFLVQPDAGVTGLYGFVSLPGEAKALTARAAGPVLVVLGGTSAGATTPLTPESSSMLGNIPDQLIKTSASDWGASSGLLQINTSTYGLGTDDYGQAAQLTRDSGNHLRLVHYSSGVKSSRVTAAATLSTSNEISVIAPDVPGFLGKWLLSPPGSDLLYEWTETWDQVRIAKLADPTPAFGNPYSVSGVPRARLYWAGGATTYVVSVEGGTITVQQLGDSAAVSKGNFSVQLPGIPPSCPSCSLMDLAIAQEKFTGYPNGAIIAVYANASRTTPALLALIDWSDVATLLNLTIQADTSSPASLDPRPDAGGGGGGNTGSGGLGAPTGPHVGGSSSGGCSSSGGAVPPLLLVALVLGWALSRRSQSVG